MNKILILTCFLMTSIVVSGTTVVGKVLSIRHHTEIHLNTEVRNWTTVYIENKTAVAPCSNLDLAIHPEDQKSLSTLLTAKTTEKKVKVWYNNDQTGEIPWSIKTCALYAIELTK